MEDAPELIHHPFRYTKACPECGEVADQAAWERALMKAHAHATGPKTAAGKAVVTQNIEGHPTPEEAQRTRFNAMKHGLFARTAQYFPASPGKYPHCEKCEHLETQACTQGPRACLKRTELFLKHQIAFESQDPAMLTGLRADTQAALQAIIDDIILTIARQGVAIEEIQWYSDKEGGFHLAQYVENGELKQIYEIKAHPLLKHLMDFIAKNSLTLADMGMTPKVQGDQELLKGFLDQEGENRESTDDYRNRIEDGIDKLHSLISHSYKKTEPITVEGELVDG